MRAAKYECFILMYVIKLNKLNYLKLIIVDIDVNLYKVN